MEMEGLYLSNALEPCSCQSRSVTINMRTTTGEGIDSYPVDVKNVNGNSIGIANDVEEYMSLWNTDVENALVGSINAVSQFSFFFTTNLGPVPAFVIGDPATGDSIAIRTEDGEPITTE